MHASAPIIPWIGGKRRLADRLLPLFPPHECYVELFCGGAALYFLRPVPAPVEIINDVNGELTNLYRVVQHHLEEFMRQFKWALSSRQVFKWLQDTKPVTLTDIQRAARFYYLQQHAFSGRVESQSFGTATTAPAINLLRIEETLSAAHLRLANAMRTCKGKMMVSINDRPEIREAFAGLVMHDLEITYAVGVDRTGREASRELVITNWDTTALGDLF